MNWLAAPALLVVCVGVTLAGGGLYVLAALGTPIMLLALYTGWHFFEPDRARIRARHRHRTLRQSADKWPDSEPDEPEPVSSPVDTGIVAKPGRPMVALLPVFDENEVTL